MRLSSSISITFLGLVLWLVSVSSGQAQSLEWAKQAGGADSDGGADIAVDSSGNSYVTGSFNGTATFGPGEANETTLATFGTREMFVAKYDSSGLLVWAKQAGNKDGVISGHGIAVDGNGNSVVTGSFSGRAVFASGEANQVALDSTEFATDAFVAKYDSSGQFVWATQAGGASAGFGIAVDSFGNSYVTGNFFGISGGSPPLPVNNMRIAKYDSSGQLVWAHGASGGNFPNIGFSVGSGIAVDGFGNSVVTGNFSGTVSFEGTTLTSVGFSSDIFVAKYDSSGQLVWARSAGGAGRDSGAGIAVDSSGNSYVTGAEDDDILVAKYNSSGQSVWAKQVAGTDPDSGAGIALDGNGNSVVTGRFAGTVALGLGEANQTILTSAGSNDIFVAKYGSSGQLVWARQAGGTDGDVGAGIAVDGSGNGYVTGSFNGTATFGAGEANETILTSAGSSDVFIAKYVPTADLAVSKQAPATLALQIGGQATLTYTIKVMNTGPEVASGVLLSDPLPAGTTFVSASPSQGKCSTPPVGSGGTASCSLGTLSNGASASITLRVKVRGGLLGGLLGIRTLTNTATVSAGTVDPNSANNAATVQTLVVTVLTQ